MDLARVNRPASSVTVCCTTSEEVLFTELICITSSFEEVAVTISRICVVFCSFKSAGAGAAAAFGSLGGPATSAASSSSGSLEDVDDEPGEEGSSSWGFGVLTTSVSFCGGYNMKKIRNP